MRFKDKVVIITGSGAGIGLASATSFAKEGAKVVLNSASGTCYKACEELKAAGYCVTAVQADISTEQGATALIQHAVDTWGKIDVLVNAAGIVLSGNVEQSSVEDWDRSMDVNARSVFLTSRLAMPYLRETKGTIVNITSTVAIKGVVNRAVYSASKGAVLSLSMSMAAEYVGEGIRVNCVCPGTVVSPSFMTRVNTAPDPQKAMENFTARQPMGRLGTPEEIAEAVLFAADENVGFMCGANIVVDGAMTV